MTDSERIARVLELLEAVGRALAPAPPPPRLCCRWAPIECEDLAKAGLRVATPCCLPYGHAGACMAAGWTVEPVPK